MPARKNFSCMFAPFGLRTITLAAVVLLMAQTASAQSLKFFKNYFITGGYAVGGVGLAGQGVNGIASGQIQINGVPEGAEVLAAFLYAQVVSNSGGNAAGTGVTFNGVPLSIPSGSGTFGLIGDPDGATPCWSGGGGTGSGGGIKKTYSLRYDVLRMLPKGASGTPKANGTHQVQLPDLGNSNSTPHALGASLVVFYRDVTKPLSAFVIYDGSWAMDNSTHGMTQEIKGFYDPAPEVSGLLTHIVGSAGNKSERLTVNGSVAGLPNGGLNLFTSSLGNAWDNVTVTTPNPQGADSLTTSVNDQGIPNADCITWSAIIYATQVNDDDGDGYLNRWESPGTSGTLVDPNGVTLPDLVAMGTPANPVGPLHKDIFIEIGYMYTTAQTTYGGVSKPKHTHLPTSLALQKVYNGFKTAPVSNPDLTQGVNVHFDVGNNHQGVSGVIPSNVARGGESLDEMATVCPPVAGDPTACQFSTYPGTVGWKTGFRVIRDALKSIPNNPNINCDAPGNDGPGQACERVFDRNREDIFRYFFFPHLLGVPKAHCLDLSGTPTTNENYGLPNVACQTTNTLFHEPNTYTGIADFGGGDGMVSMGGFLNAAGEPVGTDDQQAATFMHELGHTLMLAHGGFKGNTNCNPNYLSIMNYLFQLRLLVNVSGDKETNYSASQLATLNESSLSESQGLGSNPAPTYRTAWYAPHGGLGDAATKHCDGSAIGGGETPMIRVDGTAVGGPIDWNGVGGPVTEGLSQDINFNGVSDTALAGFNDWENIRLNQVGARRNIGVWFVTDENPATPGVEIHIGPASLGMAKADFGDWDFGDWDFGDWDFGDWDFGDWDFGDPSALNYGDLNLGDTGRNTGDWDFGDWDFGDWDFGDWDFGDWDFGDWDFGDWDFGAGAGDLGRGVDGQGDFGRPFGAGNAPVGEISGGLAVAAGLFGGPRDLKACVADGLGVPACAGTVAGTGLRVQLTWLAADAPPVAYVVYRRTATQTQFTAVGQPVGPTTLTFVDNTVVFNTTYIYYVAARYAADGEVNERASNTATVTTNTQPYTLVPVKNLPPNRPNSGSSVPLEWRFALNGVVVNSSDANPTVIIKSVSQGIEFSFNAEDPGSSGFKLPTAANGWTWSFNIQLVYPASSPNAGQNLPPATDYRIIIASPRLATPFQTSEFTIRR